MAQKPNAPRSQVSYTWNALLPHWVEWGSSVQEFLAAMDAMRIDADIEPMYSFVTETLGEPSETDRWGVANDERILERKGDYDFNNPWPLEEKIRFLAADRQQKGGEHYFWVCRAYGKGGTSRLIAYGRCNTTAELKELRKQLNVKTSNPVIDSGYKAAEVYRFCAATGWKPFKGAPQGRPKPDAQRALGAGKGQPFADSWQFPVKTIVHCRLFEAGGDYG